MRNIEPNKLWEEVARWASRGLKISGAIGFLITVTYFLRVGSLPVDNIAGMLGLASVIAFISISSFCILAFYWMLPTLAFRVLLDESGGQAKAWFLGRPSRSTLALVGDAATVDATGTTTISVDHQLVDTALPSGGVDIAKKRRWLADGGGPLNVASWCASTVAFPWTFIFACFMGDEDGSLKAALVAVAVAVGLLSTWVLGSFVLSAPANVGKANEGTKLMLVLMVTGLNAMPLYIFLSALNASSYANKLNSWNAWALLVGGLGFHHRCANRRFGSWYR